MVDLILINLSFKLRLSVTRKSPLSFERLHSKFKSSSHLSLATIISIHHLIVYSAVDWLAVSIGDKASDSLLLSIEDNMRIIPEKIKAVFSSPSSSSRKRDANATITDEDNSAGRLLDEAENGGGTIELSDAASSGLQQHSSSSSSPRPNKYVSPEKLLLKSSDDDNINDSSPSAVGKETAAEMMAYYNNSSSTTLPHEEEVGGDEELSNHHQRRNRKEKKKGHKFLFFCCDSKRAVIILNTFMFVLSSFVFTMAILNRDPSNSSNDDDISAYKQAMIMQGCGIFITFATILGAFWYSISVVCVGLLFTTYQLTMGIIKMTKFHWTYADTNSIVGVLLPVSINILLFYAEGLFISEISDGIMSDETYISRERYSFCCTRCPCC